ncbi:hydroxysqualene dehydroxylase HpnE [Melioribacteraceae bacterium 4301-Me]|uniref:hydroxysqualene dehydroxylase HpnE n=1 Tax=Pyranulibacter aquaticus TaxID=3163344 RepID=UPI0035998ED2
MTKCIVVGGGLAGLSAATLLLEKGINVHLIESTPKFGGKVYSLLNEKYDDEYDNGQHILMGCYYSTLNFLSRINSIENLEFQKSLRIPFVKKGNYFFYLDTHPKHYPLNLLKGILNYKALTFYERLKVIDFFIDLIFTYDEDLENLTVKEWLVLKKQNANVLKSFWKILVIGALNTELEIASASQFSYILKKIFFEGNDASTILLPKVSLNKLFVNNSLKYIREKGGSFTTSEKLTEVVLNNSRVSKLKTNKKNYSDFDFVVIAVPFYSLIKIKPFDMLYKDNEGSFTYSSILNVHLWLKENNFDEPFYGMIDSPVHWLFNHNKHITLVSSSADKLISLSNLEILEIFYSELESFFQSFNKKNVIDWKVVKEKRATFVPDKKIIHIRKKITSPFSNLFFAGDWVDTNLPSTIESAIYSGQLAVEKIIN